MKLLTHNLLSSHVRGVSRGFPLLLQASEVKINNVDFNQEFITRMIPKMEWSALVNAAESVSIPGSTVDRPRARFTSASLGDNEEAEPSMRHSLCCWRAGGGPAQVVQTGQRPECAGYKGA
ncbi:multifunctional methyltransferase subunit TRM112-like protein [Pristis pectinata]|uniref:multifunctional methyltransferase subunit TRM112-like protein n=1 Tax=Pristis pectinata TaxID=685728 RepID=UPI00223CB672|nr:multifunctional methyltransferase subunit TRM112-like protein [Pristis pectinata]